MFDIIEGKATPSLARKLLTFAQISPLDLSQEIVDLATRDLLPKFTEYEPAQHAAQLFADFAHRGLMIDQSNERFGLIGILEYLQSIGRDKIIFVTPTGSEAINIKTELKLFKDIVPGKYIVKQAKQINDDDDAFVIFKGMQWGLHHHDLQRWAFAQNDILVYYPYSNVLDASTIGSIMDFHYTLINDQYRSYDYTSMILGAKNQVKAFEALGISVIPQTR